MLLTAALTGCGYNDIQRLDEHVKADWSEALNQYQRRADPVPKLVATVKGFAQKEQQVFTQVTEARARAASRGPRNGSTIRRYSSVSPEAQAAMSSALSRLLVVAENYP